MNILDQTSLHKLTTQRLLVLFRSIRKRCDTLIAKHERGDCRCLYSFLSNDNTGCFAEWKFYRDQIKSVLDGRNHLG